MSRSYVATLEQWEDAYFSLGPEKRAWAIERGARRTCGSRRTWRRAASGFRYDGERRYVAYGLCGHGGRAGHGAYGL